MKSSISEIDEPVEFTVRTSRSPAETTSHAPRTFGPAVRRQAMVATLLVGGCLVLWSAFRGVTGSVDGSNAALVYYTLTRGDLPIVVTERGSLESQVQTAIRCDVESVGSDRGGGSGGTQILFIVPNGKAVKQGELLVELDAAAIKDRVDNQVIAYEKANAEHVQAVNKYENQKKQNEILAAEAKLKVELADLALKMYGDEEDGTYQITLQEVNLKIEEAQNKILEAQAAMALQATERHGIEMLYGLGYRGKGDVEQARYRYLQAEDSLVRATNSLKTAVSSRKKLEVYEREMQIKELDGTRKTAAGALEQVKNDGVSLLAQADAARTAAEKTLAKEKEKLEKYNAQLAKCKIYAPHDGMVVYAVDRGRGGSTVIVGEGIFVYERQRILTLPDLSQMQVRTTVHESVLDQVREGLPATIRVDAASDRTYRGTVYSVGVLPDDSGYFSSDIKVYETFVRIDERVTHLKPGMNAVVEIHVDRLDDVLSVPVQAVVQIDRESWCYRDSAGDVERVKVELGVTNDKFVEIRNGLEEGDRVILNPTSIVDDGTSQGRSIAPDAGAPEPIDRTAAASGSEPPADRRPSAERATPGDSNDAEPAKRSPSLRRRPSKSKSGEPSGSPPASPSQP